MEARFSKWADDLREVVISADQKTALNEFIERAFIAEKKRLENNYRAMFTNLTINSLQRYKIKYILAKIAQYIESKE